MQIVNIVLKLLLRGSGRVPAADGRLPCNQASLDSLGAVHGDYRRNFTAPSLVHQIIGPFFNGLRNGRRAYSNFMSFPRQIL